MFFSGIADEAGSGIDTQIRAHRELGWKHVEVRNVDGVNLTDLCDRTFEETIEKLGEAGLAISCFASQLCNWSRPITKHVDIDRDELARAIPRMQRVGCPYIRTMSYPNVGWPEEEWRDEVIRRLKLLARMAEDGGVTLVHENCNGWGGLGPEQTFELLQRVNSPSLKLVWDTGNPVYHDQNAWEYYRAVREHVVYVHVKDAVKKDGKVVGRFPGEGDGAVEDTVRDLLQRGYGGGFSIEPHMTSVVHTGERTGNADAMYENYVEYGKRFMAIVERVG